LLFAAATTTSILLILNYSYSLNMNAFIAICAILTLIILCIVSGKKLYNICRPELQNDQALIQRDNTAMEIIQEQSRALIQRDNTAMEIIQEQSGALVQIISDFQCGKLRYHNEEPGTSAVEQKPGSLTTPPPTRRPLVQWPVCSRFPANYANGTCSTTYNDGVNPLSTSSTGGKDAGDGGEQESSADASADVNEDDKGEKKSWRMKISMGQLNLGRKH